MSKCDLKIVYDRPDRRYRGGEAVTGTVLVQVNKNVRCDGLMIEHFWQTHGRGNTATGDPQTNVPFRGDLQAGQSVSYPFSFVAPQGPPTYHGHYVNIDHYVNVRVDIPWALDPKHKEEYILLPGRGDYGHLPGEAAGQAHGKGFLAKLGMPVGIAMIVIGFFLFCPFGLVLVPAGCVILFFALRKSFAEKKIGKVELLCGPPNVRPGGGVPVRLAFTPRGSAHLNGITAKLTGVEQCVSGSGTDRTTHTHKLHERVFALSPARDVTANQPLRVEGMVPIPQTNAFTFHADDNDLIWKLEVRIDIPLWPDWLENRVLIVRPVAEAPDVEVAELAEIPEVGAEQAAGMAAVDEAGPPAGDAFEPIGSETPSGEALFAEEPSLFEQPAAEEAPLFEQPVPEPPSAEQRPTPDEPPGRATLAEIVRRIAAASKYGFERDEIIKEYAGQLFPCTIEIDKIERTYGYVPDERFRNGQTVTGRIAGADCTVSLELSEARNEELQSIGPGGTLRADCALLKWSSIYDRLEMREA